MSCKIGFIGLGNMATAMIGGIVNSNILDSKNIYGYDHNEEKNNFMKNTYNISIPTDIYQLTKICDVIFLCVKPYMYKDVALKIKDSIKEDVIVVTVAPGITIKNMVEYFQKNLKIIRTMPNTPALVGEGMTGVAPCDLSTEDDVDKVVSILNTFGKTAIVSEKQLDTVGAVSGSSPAFVYLFIEALADSAVRGGIKREDAYKFAAQAVVGGGKMVLETGLHPGILKDNVCSPGGTTIEGITSLEKNGFTNSIYEGIKACLDKTESMKS